MNLYIIDANAIRVISYDLLREKKERITLVALEEVLHEISGREKVMLFDGVKLGIASFIKMSEIMQYKYVKVLVDYIENKGAADVSLLAYALTVNENKLITETPHIVTDDVKLRIACNELSLNWISSNGFKAL